jgi:GNAT superfamily N-acetyltransferase
MTADPAQTASSDIRRAGASDAARLAPLFEDYCRFYEQCHDLVHARQFVSDRLSNREAVVFLAFTEGASVDDDAPVGFALLYPKFSSTSLRRDWLLNDLFVDPAHRRRGHARALLDAASEFARNTGAYKLQLKTQQTNTSARTLYESAGWKPDQRFLTYALTLR